MQNEAMKGEAYQRLQNLLTNPMVKIVDLYVKGNWLCAVLSSRITFSVRNK